jgi:hypothetical protein
MLRKPKLDPLLPFFPRDRGCEGSPHKVNKPGPGRVEVVDVQTNSLSLGSLQDTQDPLRRTIEQASAVTYILPSG